ncbi:hypothetical protein BS50DRAFT_63327 [Corynespora cassiicola Philippines]|uniref:Uncharacterized protein n=1 Tax=Corynespora cassiicola Philippines TaxID=1448308 RepID=A0A2T2NJL2_CORCC|nr:hypothetical protein BS50DRAFT_63327 [Corynespora cassiicola Philippines]
MLVAKSHALAMFYFIFFYRRGRTCANNDWVGGNIKIMRTYCMVFFSLLSLSFSVYVFPLRSLLGLSMRGSVCRAYIVLFFTRFIGHCNLFAPRMVWFGWFLHRGLGWAGLGWWSLTLGLQRDGLGWRGNKRICAFFRGGVWGFAVGVFLGWEKGCGPGGGMRGWWRHCCKYDT